MSFSSTVDTELQNAITKAKENYVATMQETLNKPFANANTDSTNALHLFDNEVEGQYKKAITKITDLYTSAKNAIDKPWKDAIASGSPLHTFYTTAVGWMDQVITKAQNAANAISTPTDTTTPNLTTNQNPDSDSGGGGGGGGSDSWIYSEQERVKALQRLLKEVFGYDLGTYGKNKDGIDGIYGSDGSKTREAVKKMQKKIGVPVNGKYDDTTRRALPGYLDSMIHAATNNDHPEAAELYRKYRNNLPPYLFAKGTLGTKKDQWAITDESWIGEEITLAAGKNGQLQYLKKGSAVMPADISANLVEWGKLNPNMMGISNMTEGINLMSNYINKPEIKIDVENFLNVGTVSRDTLPELEKLMDKKIDTFAKQLNASIRKFK